MPSLAGVGDGDDVMSGPTQRFDDGERNVLVGEEARHERLRALVVSNLLIDLVSVATHVRPGAGAVFRSQVGVEPEQVGLGGSESSSLLQDPDRNARTDDDWLTAAHAVDCVDARVRVLGLLGNALQQLRLNVLRVPYDLPTAQAKIIAAGLPDVLAQRLAIGR